MAKPKTPPPPLVKRVWRITDAAPQGEFVEVPVAGPSKTLSPKTVPLAVPTDSTDGPDSQGGWVVSSYELLSGAEVTEGYDTVPGNLFDAFFDPPPAPPPKKGPARG